MVLVSGGSCFMHVACVSSTSMSNSKSRALLGSARCLGHGVAPYRPKNAAASVSAHMTPIRSISNDVVVVVPTGMSCCLSAVAIISNDVVVVVPTGISCCLVASLSAEATTANGAVVVVLKGTNCCISAVATTSLVGVAAASPTLTLRALPTFSTSIFCTGSGIATAERVKLCCLGNLDSVSNPFRKDELHAPSSINFREGPNRVSGASGTAASGWLGRRGNMFGK
mmetsp:Transcript_51461/g.102009  ORF Transcript_51461/g.102009 Transcript_51461/m.102009 type:complete len:226 (+) Transcript_51461:135-812(+)